MTPEVGDMVTCTVDGREREVTRIDGERVYIDPPTYGDESFIPQAAFDVGLWEITDEVQ